MGKTTGFETDLNDLNFAANRRRKSWNRCSDCGVYHDATRGVRNSNALEWGYTEFDWAWDLIFFWRYD